MKFFFLLGSFSLVFFHPSHFWRCFDGHDRFFDSRFSPVGILNILLFSAPILPARSENLPPTPARFASSLPFSRLLSSSALRTEKSFRLTALWDARNSPDGCRFALITERTIDTYLNQSNSNVLTVCEKRNFSLFHAPSRAIIISIFHSKRQSEKRYGAE